LIIRERRKKIEKCRLNIKSRSSRSKYKNKLIVNIVKKIDEIIGIKIHYSRKIKVEIFFEAVHQKYVHFEDQG
jgi:hypothetical protein